MAESNVNAPMRMRGVTWPGGRGHPKPHRPIWNQRPQFAHSYNYITFMGLQRRLRGVYMWALPLYSGFRSKIRPKNGGYSGITGCKC